MRVANYDSIASKYDRRYDLYEYAGVKDTLTTFLWLAEEFGERGFHGSQAPARHLPGGALVRQE